MKAGTGRTVCVRFTPADVCLALMKPVIVPVVQYTLGWLAVPDSIVQMGDWTLVQPEQHSTTFLDQLGFDF